MKILLRSADPVRRLASRFDDYIAPHWPHHTRLLALAAMYGYSSWEELVRECTPNAPPLVYDQDLPSDIARQERWIAMAKQVCLVIPLLLPEAIEVVCAIHPTSRATGEKPIWYAFNDVFDRELVKENDVWWVSSGHAGHILVPPGFHYSEASFVPDIAKFRLKKRPVFDNVIRNLSILEPEQRNGFTKHPHSYHRRAELPTIAPIPYVDLLLAPKKYASKLREFFDENYPSWTESERAEKLDEWLSAIKTLRLASGLSPKSKKRWCQTTVSARERIGKSWHWPLEFKDAQPEAIEACRLEAMRVNDVILKYFGEDPGYIDN